MLVSFIEKGMAWEGTSWRLVEHGVGEIKNPMWTFVKCLIDILVRTVLCVSFHLIFCGKPF